MRDRRQIIGGVLEGPLAFDNAINRAAGIVLGVRVPIVLTSRGDSVRAHLASCAVAALYARSLRARPAG
jgi:hypothetical protein